MEATIIELIRREQSRGELRAAFAPGRRHIEDPIAIADSKNLPRSPTVSSLDSVALHWKPPPGRPHPPPRPRGQAVRGDRGSAGASDHPSDVAGPGLLRGRGPGRGGGR